MAIELTPIEDHKPIAPDFSCSRVGCIMINKDESWIAACPAISYTSEGIGPFDDLPSEILWMVNRSYHDIQALLEINGDKELRLSNWMRIGIDDMLREWGIEKLDTSTSADTIASILDRVLNICFETVRKAGLSPRKGQLHNIIERSPSLSTGIRNLVNQDMNASVPKKTKVRERISEALNYGVFQSRNRKVQDGEFMLHCQIPRLSHALRVTLQKVPAAGEWEKARLVDDSSEQKPERKSPEMQSRELEQKIPELESLERPVMIIAKVRERSGLDHDYLKAWVGSRTISRVSYTLEETIAMLPWFTFEDYSAIVGPDWRQSVTGKIINSLVDVCGGLDVAATSWSANMAAENILCGGFRKVSGNDELPPECVWLTVRDRLEMIRPIESLMNCGATLVSTYAGGLVVKIPEDPEIMTQAVNAIWEAGLHLPIGTVRQLQIAGIEMPVDPDAWGGAPEDLILGQCLQKDFCEAMWRFDEILNQNPEDRKPAFDQLLQ